MLNMFLTAIVLVALAGTQPAASTSFSDINQQLVLKLESLDQKLVTVQEKLERNQRGYQNGFRRFREEMEEETEGADKESKEFRQLLEILNTKLQSNSEESSSMKLQMSNLFKTMSIAKGNQSKHKPVERNSTADEREAEKEARASDAGSAMKENNKEGIADSRAEDLQGIVESDDKGITATLEIRAPGGISYTRWGRTTCEGDADILYTGYAAGKYKDTSVTMTYAGSETICLHGTPEWGNIASAYKGRAPISGVQYGFTNDDPFSRENVGGEPLTNHDMPCAVCHLETRTHQLMIPARKSCPDGWTAEYWGYLVTSVYTNYGGTYQCLDQVPEGTPEGADGVSSIQNVYAAEIECRASLECPPYEQAYEVPCVVCTK